MGTRGFEECSRNKNGTRGSIGYTLGGSSRKCVTSALQSPISRSESRGNLSGNSGTSGEPHKQESILTWNGTPFLDRKQHVSASAINGCTCATTLTTSQSTPISMFLRKYWQLHWQRSQTSGHQLWVTIQEPYYHKLLIEHLAMSTWSSFQGHSF